MSLSYLSFLIRTNVFMTLLADIILPYGLFDVPLFQLNGLRPQASMIHIHKSYEVLRRLGLVRKLGRFWLSTLPHVRAFHFVLGAPVSIQAERFINI